MNIFIKKILLISLFISGCGDSEKSNQKVTPITTDYIVQSVKVGEVKIDLTNFISYIDHQDLNIVKSELDYTNNECLVLGHSDKSIDVESNSPGACNLKVQMKNDDLTLETKLFVNFTNSLDVTVPTLGRSVLLGKSLHIDLATENQQIASLITDGYQLAQKLEIYGDVTVNHSGTVLSISNTNTLGVNRIIYFLEKNVDGEKDSKVGVVDITVSRDGNFGPSILINPLTINADTNTYIDIDLTNYFGSSVISDPDNLDEVQILDLKPLNGGTVFLGSKSDPILPNSDSAKHNKKFHFSHFSPGTFYVNYTVSDHNGGFANGVIVFILGSLTSPNTPLANKPGIMVESVIVLDDDISKEQVLFRPKLAKESSDDSKFTTQSNEKWAYFDHADGEMFCNNLGLRLPTSEAMNKLILSKKENITQYLGWPTGVGNDSSRPKVNYLIASTEKNKDTSFKSVDPITGLLSDRAVGLVSCTTYQDRDIRINQSSIFVDNDNPSKIVSVTNFSDFSNLNCSSNNSNVVNVLCDKQGNITVTGVNPGVTDVIIYTDGESINGNESPASISVTSRVNSTLPTVSNIELLASFDNGTSFSKITDFNLVRPTITHLKVSYDYHDIDNDVEEGTSIRWELNNSVNTLNKDSFYIPTTFGTLSVAVTPKSIAGEIGLPVSINVDIVNIIPEVTDLKLIDTDVRGFTSSDVINPVFTFYDKNNDSLTKAKYLYQIKSPFQAEWDNSQIQGESSGTIPTYSDANRHFNDLKDYELRLQVSVTDNFDASSINYYTNNLFPIASTESNSINVSAGSDPLVFHHLGEISSPINTIAELDNLCAASIPKRPGFSVAKGARDIHLAKYITEWSRGVNSPLHLPRYYSTNFENRYKFPSVSGGRLILYSFNSFTGSSYSSESYKQNDVGLVCIEEKPLMPSLIKELTFINVLSNKTFYLRTKQPINTIDYPGYRHVTYVHKASMNSENFNFLATVGVGPFNQENFALYKITQCLYDDLPTTTPAAQSCPTVGTQGVLDRYEHKIIQPYTKYSLRFERLWVGNDRHHRYIVLDELGRNIAGSNFSGLRSIGIGSRELGDMEVSYFSLVRDGLNGTHFLLNAGAGAPQQDYIYSLIKGIRQPHIYGPAYFKKDIDFDRYYFELEGDCNQNNKCFKDVQEFIMKDQAAIN